MTETTPLKYQFVSRFYSNYPDIAPDKPQTIEWGGKMIYISTYNKSTHILHKLDLLDYANGKEGISVEMPTGNYIVIINDAADRDNRKILLHELGHILLNHTSINRILGCSEDPEVQLLQENEAEKFVQTYYDLDYQNSYDNYQTNALIKVEQERIIKEQKFKLTDRKIILPAVVIAITVIGLFIFVQPEKKPPQSSTDTQSIKNHLNLSEEILGRTVYITPSGNKFHIINCRYVDETHEHMSISEAIEGGYGACLICEPLKE